jgi:hypothetical protein
VIEMHVKWIQKKDEYTTPSEWLVENTGKNLLQTVRACPPKATDWRTSRARGLRTITIQARELDLTLVEHVERQHVIRDVVFPGQVSLFYRGQMGVG